MFPFLGALGITAQSGIVITSDYETAGAVALLWALTILISTARKHENVFECLIDTFGIPGFVGSAIFFGKGIGIHF
jgi:hypothetical protein